MWFQRKYLIQLVIICFYHYGVGLKGDILIKVLTGLEKSIFVQLVTEVGFSGVLQLVIMVFPFIRNYFIPALFPFAGMLKSGVMPILLIRYRCFST